MNTREYHSTIDDLHKITWWRVNIPDKGSGLTSIHAYVQADSEENVKEICSRHDHFSMYDASKASVVQGPSSWDDVEHTILMAGGPNAALGQDGEIIQRSDIKQ